jgi:hypothetical protein
MKPQLTIVLLLSASQLFGVSAFAQGSLTPPGAPAATFKTLQQIGIEGNDVPNNHRGIDVDSTGNIIIRNSARPNLASYSQIVAGNTRGEVVDTSASGGTLDETHSAWANFSY